MWPLTFFISHRIWSDGPIHCYREGLACIVWIAGLLGYHSLLQSLLGENHNITEPPDIPVQQMENWIRRRGGTRQRRRGKWRLETICVPNHTHPFCCSPAGCMWGCHPLFSHGGLDFPGIALLLLCGIQHSGFRGFCQWPERAPWGHLGLPGCKLSPDALGCVLHLLPL